MMPKIKRFEVHLGGKTGSTIEVAGEEILVTGNGDLVIQGRKPQFTNQNFMLAALPAGSWSQAWEINAPYYYKDETGRAVKEEEESEEEGKEEEGEVG